jgi:hypothetical protein
MDTARISAVSRILFSRAEEPAAAVLQQKQLEFMKPNAVMVVPPSLNVRILYLSQGHLSTNQKPQVVYVFCLFFVHK